MLTIMIPFEKIYDSILKCGEAEFSYLGEGYVIQRVKSFLCLWVCSDTPMTVAEVECSNEFSITDVINFCNEKIFNGESIVELEKEIKFM